MTTLSANVTADDVELPTDTADPEPGSLWTLGDEVIEVGGSASAGTDEFGRRLPGVGFGKKRWIVQRAVAGTTAASHLSGATLTRYYPDAPGAVGGADLPTNWETETTEGPQSVLRTKATLGVGDSAVWQLQAGDNVNTGVVLGVGGPPTDAQVNVQLEATGEALSQIALWTHDTDGGAYLSGTGQIDLYARPSTVAIRVWDAPGNTLVFSVSDTGLIDAPGLPTVDPEVAGRLWNDAGTVKVSGG